MALGWSKITGALRAIREAARLSLRKEPVGVLALIVSAVGLYTQISATSVQTEFIRSQGENIKVELGRDRMFHRQPILLESFNMLVSKWDVTISNTSFQTPATITHFAVFKKSGQEYFKMRSDDMSFWKYTIFFSRETGDPVSLPFTVAAGATMNLSMSLDLQITEEAANRLRELTKSAGAGGVDLSQAEGLYSYETLQRGVAKDIFGNVGYDNGGFNLAIHQRDRNTIDFPVFRLEFTTNRGKVYSAYSSWYYMMVIAPDPMPQVTHSEGSNPPDATNPAGK